jgi:hypothetical protein
VVRKKWFVMLRNGNLPPSPLIDDDEQIALFDSEGEADDAAERNPLGIAFGWASIEWWTES